MKTIPRAPILLVIALMMSATALTQSKRGPSTQEERQTAVKAARLLESDPFHSDAKKIRAWFTLWLIEIPDISIEVCTGYLEPLVSKDKNHSSEIVTQMMFSSAAFIIEHPDQAKDKVAVNLAGLEGSLKAYEAILKAKPKAKLDFLDTLIAKREKGELRAYVEEIMKTKCKSKL